MGGKNNKSITINQSLDLSKFRCRSNHSLQRLKYKIASIILHYGASTSCGHYTALGYSAQGNLYTFDDSQVYSSTFSNVSSSAYVIMYELDQAFQTSRTAKSTITSNGSYTNGISSKLENSSGSHRPLTSSCPSPLSSQERPESEKKTWKQGKVYISNGNHPQPTAASRTITPTSTSSTSASGSKSLVPYMSDSGSDSDDSSKCLTNGNLTNGHSSDKCHSPSKRSNFLLTSKNSNLNSPKSNCEKVEKSNSCNPSQETNSTRVPEISSTVQSNGWLITDSSSASPSKLSANADKSVERGVGHWSVTEAKHSESINDQSHSNGTSNHCWRKPLPPLENGHSNHNNKSSSSNNSSISNGNVNCNGNSSKSSVLNHLQNSSHLGYGNKVNSWNGGQSQVNRDAEKDRYESSKRSYSQSYNDEIDRGKVKKIKYSHNKSDYTNGSSNGDKNRNSSRFDSYTEDKFMKSQRYKNVWSRSQHHHPYKNYNKYSRHSYKHSNNRAYRDNYWRKK